MSTDTKNLPDISISETLELLEQICKIPAPSHHEQKRAGFCKEWLEAQGAEGVYIDDACNMLYPLNCDGREDIVLFLAHTDTVFPDLTEPMPYKRDNERIYSPGVGDNAVCLAMMLMVIKHIIQNNLKPRCGILFAANACEEGLGNLKGVRQIMNDYKGRIERAYTFDGRYNELICKCVGSHRYRISVETEGGHSFTAFGKRNAICAAAELICSLDRCEVPREEESKTTYNVGLVEGGTSVNTIAQNASFLYEYRSDSLECLNKMEALFQKKIEQARLDQEVTIKVESIGIRPCEDLPERTVFNQMVHQAKDICQRHSGMICNITSGSTDANVPMSMGIPAICVGSYQGGGMHTREEYLEIASIPVGLNITADLILSYF